MTFCKLLYHRKCKRRGVGGRKKTNLLNVVCERPLTVERLPLGFPYQKHQIFPSKGGVHKLRLQDLSFFDHLPTSVYIFYGIKVYKKSIILTTYPPPLVNVVCERPQMVNLTITIAIYLVGK